MSHESERIYIHANRAESQQRCVADNPCNGSNLVETVRDTAARIHAAEEFNERCRNELNQDIILLARHINKHSECDNLEIV